VVDVLGRERRGGTEVCERVGGHGERGVDVGGGADADRPIPAISPASRPFFVGSLTMQPTISKSGCATSSRITIFPTKPVPWTITL
jgi:hypothetical protein